MKRIVLIGGGGHCRSCIDVIESTKAFEIHGILDTPQKVGDFVLGYKIIGTDHEIPDLIAQGMSFMVTIGQIGYSQKRNEIFNTLEQAQASMPVVISNRAYVSAHASVGAGTIVMHDALVNSGASVGKNCIINTKALIEHDVHVKDHVHVATGALVNGAAIVGTGAFIGSGAVIVQGACVPDKGFIKADSLVKP